MPTQYKSKDEYINKPAHCPNMACNSDDIEIGEIDVDGAIAVQEVTCNTCGTAWRDVYSLTSYDVTGNSKK